jgi:hypothetical protein
MQGFCQRVLGYRINTLKVPGSKCISPRKGPKSLSDQALHALVWGGRGYASFPYVPRLGGVPELASP